MDKLCLEICDLRTITGSREFENLAKMLLAMRYAGSVFGASLQPYLEHSDFEAKIRASGKKRYCETQLITTVHDPEIGLDRWQQVDAILLDFSKAFDKVPHQRLAVKLHHYGIRDKNLSWIQSFLTDTNQHKVGKVLTARENPGGKTWVFPGWAILPEMAVLGTTG